MKDRAWLELSRPALAHNVALLRAQLPQGCDLMAVVKGNAYGHGLVGMAIELCKLGVHDFCVATAEEGAKLRRQGARGTILVLGYTSPSQFWLLEAAGLREAVLVSIAQALDENLKHRAGERMRIEAVFFSNQFGVLGQTPGAARLLALHRSEQK